MKKPLIGFIGQGWIGKNYANDYEKRGYSIVRYSLEFPYSVNKDQIKECDIVIVAVPTPTTIKGFDDSAVKKVLTLVGKGKIVVIKSTLLMGRTVDIQKDNPHCLVLHCPEFLSENTASHDVENPDRNIIGIPKTSPIYFAAAKQVLKTMPKAPFEFICTSHEAELIKYAHNIHGYIQVVFSNLLYDMSSSLGGDWGKLHAAFKADPMMCHRYLTPVHKSGRGAGGNCFVKDMEAFIESYGKLVGDKEGLMTLKSIRNKNIDLLVKSRKDLVIIESVYGKKILNKNK